MPSKGWFKSASGRLYLTGIPLISLDQSELRIDQLDYSLDTKNILIKSVDWITHETLLEELRKAAAIPLQDELANAKAQANDQLGQLTSHLTAGNRGNGDDFPSISVDGVGFGNQEAFALISAKGTMSGKLNP